MILLVEDEERAREVFARILKNAGYAVMEAADGLEALSLLEDLPCDLVVSDILMPKLNGYALVARIRAKWPNMPIILTSGYLLPRCSKDHDERVGRIYTEAPGCSGANCDHSTLDATRFDTRPLGRRRGAGT